MFLNMPSCREGREESRGETPRRTEVVHAVTHEHAPTGHLPTRRDELHAFYAPSSPVSPFLTGVARTCHPPHQQICAVRSHVIKHISLSYSQQHISGILQPHGSHILPSITHEGASARSSATSSNPRNHRLRRSFCAIICNAITPAQSASRHQWLVIIGIGFGAAGHRLFVTRGLIITVYSFKSLIDQIRAIRSPIWLILESFPT